MYTRNPMGREVKFVPTKVPYGPRKILNGRQNQGVATFFISKIKWNWDKRSEVLISETISD